jgi:hypothetical protein
MDDFIQDGSRLASSQVKAIPFRLDQLMAIVTPIKGQKKQVDDDMNYLRNCIMS